VTILKSTTWRPISANIGGAMARPIHQLLLHQQVGNGSLFGYFNNPANEVSAHFWVAKAGLGEQYVDTARSAWHARDANGRCLGVELEGHPGEPITAEQIATMGRIMAELAQTDGLALVEANTQAERGVGYHRLWVATACPSDLRLSARPAMIAAARGGAAPPSAPSAPAAPAPPAGGGGAPPWPGVYLRATTTDPSARTWQAQMSARGWRLGIDGIYGPESAGVCRAFQTEKGLHPVDGVVGPVTWGATWTAPIT
jgi:hypothetical protein